MLSRTEIYYRVLYCALSFILAMFVCELYKENVLYLLFSPCFIFSGVYEVFIENFESYFFFHFFFFSLVGIICVFPVFCFNGYYFICRSFYKFEKKHCLFFFYFYTCISLFFVVILGCGLLLLDFVVYFTEGLFKVVFLPYTAWVVWFWKVLFFCWVMWFLPFVFYFFNFDCVFFFNNFKYFYFFIFFFVSNFFSWSWSNFLFFSAYVLLFFEYVFCLFFVHFFFKF